MTDRNKRRAARGVGYKQNLGYTEGRVSLTVGQEIDIKVHGIGRPATVLAIIGPEALLEHVLPSGRSALRRVSVNYSLGTDPGRPYKNESYRTLPMCWLVKMARDNIQWAGSPQQAVDLHMSPLEFFLRRWPEEEYRLYLPSFPAPEPEPPTPQQMQVERRRTDKVREGLT